MSRAQAIDHLPRAGAALLLGLCLSAPALAAAPGHTARGQERPERRSEWRAPDLATPLRRLGDSTRDAWRRTRRALDPPPASQGEAPVPAPQPAQSDAPSRAQPAPGFAPGPAPEPEPLAASEPPGAALDRSRALRAALAPVAYAPLPPPRPTPAEMGGLALALALGAVGLARRLHPRRREAWLAPPATVLLPRTQPPPEDLSLTQPLLASTAPTTPRTPSRYEILGEIGRGGMAVVYRARDTRLDRVVALKRISDTLREHPRAVDLLQREARAAARLNHPNIVTVHDVDQEDGVYFITMELLEGEPLPAILKRRGRIAPKQVARLGEQVAAGLAYAHERQIVHRDIKTANLFLTTSRTVKIMDFGLAKVVAEVRRRATLIGGTPSYMPPEQAEGREVDGRTDLYALGVTLYELLTGALPFGEGDPAHHHRHTQPTDPREHASEIPDALATLLLELLAKHPDERPASADAVARRLREIP